MMKSIKQRGVAMIEFVIILPFFIGILFAIIYGGMLFHDWNALNEAVRAGARYGAVANSGSWVTGTDGVYADNSKQKNVVNIVKDRAVFFSYKLNGTDIYVEKVTSVEKVDASGNKTTETLSEPQIKVTAIAKRIGYTGAATPKPSDGFILDVLLNGFQPDTISSTLMMRCEDEGASSSTSSS